MKKNTYLDCKPLDSIISRLGPLLYGPDSAAISRVLISRSPAEQDECHIFSQFMQSGHGQSQSALWVTGCKWSPRLEKKAIPFPLFILLGFFLFVFFFVFSGPDRIRRKAGVSGHKSVLHLPVHKVKSIAFISKTTDHLSL